MQVNKNHIFGLFILLSLSLIITHVNTALSEPEHGGEAVLLVLDTNIDGGAVSFVESSVKFNPGRVYIIEVHSYGGYLSAADRIINVIDSSGSYCIAWIPRGGYAVSAAALVSLSCREVYMAPGSVIGGIKPSPEDPKVVEYIKARLRSFLERRGLRNISWVVDDLVDRAKSYSYEEAVEIGLAKPARDLEEVVSTQGLELKSRIYPSLWDKLISIISHPLVSEILLFAGVVLILVEVFTTGFQGYGIAGGLMLVFALYGMTIIPSEILHVALVLAGAVLLIIELFTPGFGLFGVTGILLTATGFALTVLSTPGEALTSYIVTVSIGFGSIAGLFIFIGYKAASTARIKRRTLTEQLVSAIGYAKTDISEVNPGTVYVLNEDWTAYSVRGSIPAGSRVRVVRVEGLKLYVERVD